MTGQTAVVARGLRESFLEYRTDPIKHLFPNTAYHTK